MTSDTPTPAPDLRRRAEALIARHYRDPVTVADLARALGTSRRALQRAFAHEGRTSVAEQLRTARLRAGAELLAGQSLGVADIARIAGYRSASAFSAAFARRYGLSPARYRAAARAARAARAPAERPTGRPAAPDSARRVTPPPTAATAQDS